MLELTQDGNAAGIDWEGGYKGEVKEHKLKELKCDEDEIDKYEEGRYEPQGLDHKGDKVHEYGERIYEPEYDMLCDVWTTWVQM